MIDWQSLVSAIGEIRAGPVSFTGDHSLLIASASSWQKSHPSVLIRSVPTDYIKAPTKDQKDALASQSLRADQVSFHTVGANGSLIGPNGEEEVAIPPC